MCTQSVDALPPREGELAGRILVELPAPAGGCSKCDGREIDAAIEEELQKSCQDYDGIVDWERGCASENPLSAETCFYSAYVWGGVCFQ